MTEDEARDACRRAADLLGDRAAADVAIGPRTTYRVGGAAALLTTVETDADLATVASAVQATGVEVLVVGKGSNLLVADRGFAGLAVVLGEEFATVVIDGTTVRAGGAASLPVVARRTAAAGLTGFEWAVGVPGSIGGAVRMNAGGHGSDMAASVQRVRVVDLGAGEDGWVPVDQLALRYRQSRLRPAELVVQATDSEPDRDELAAKGSYEMAATVDFGLDAKQGLLDLRSENARMRLVTRLFRAAVKRLDFVERAQARARSNGKVRFG